MPPRLAPQMEDWRGHSWTVSAPGCFGERFLVFESAALESRYAALIAACAACASCPAAACASLCRSTPRSQCREGSAPPCRRRHRRLLRPSASFAA